MVAPTFKKATDTDAGDSTKYGAPDIKYIEDVLDGTHGTDRVQASVIETTGSSNVQTDLNNKAPITQKLDDFGAPDDNTDLDATSSAHGLMPKLDKVKLDTVETNADVTDATNVNAAGATMNTDTDVSGNSYVLDEDNMVSNDNTKLPTQQSVKTYVDNEIASALASALEFKGDYNASTNTPDLDTSPSGIGKGDFYVVTAAGTFFTESVSVGDALIAKQDNPTLLTHWTLVSESLTASEIKTKYESNSNTNAFTDAEQTKLSGIETSATADQSDSEIETAYNNQVSIVSQSEAENGTSTTVRRWTAQRVAQAISALASSSGSKWKEPVRVATTANGALATAYENGDTVDGVVLATGDRILLKDQSTGSENGIYTVNATGAPTRATDYDGNSEVVGAFVWVLEGTANGQKLFKNTNTGTITIGSTSLTFTEFSGGGGLTDVVNDTTPQLGGNLDAQSLYKVINLIDPTSAQDALTKNYYDTNTLQVGGTPSAYTHIRRNASDTAYEHATIDVVNQLGKVKWKEPVRAASTGNINLAGSVDPSPFDGVTLANGDRVLLKDQTTDTENGIYDCITATDPSTWTRSEDFNGGSEAEGAVVFVREGTANGGEFWYVTDTGTIGIGSNTITFTQLSTGGGSHALLSSTHSDATTGTVVRGDIITGQGVTPTWTRKALGSANNVLYSDGTDLVYGKVSTSLFDTDVSDSFKLLVGTALDTPAITVTSNGTTITLSLEKSGGGDIRYFFTDGVYTLDCTPAQTLTLTAGTDTSPVLNRVYLDQADKTLKTTTGDWPSTEFAAVARVVCQSAASLQTDGAYAVHAWTDHITGVDGGHLQHLNYWIRHQPATWDSGIVLTPTITTNGVAEDNIDIATSTGEVLQLHPHDYPAFDTSTGSEVYIVNKNGAAYTTITDLNLANEDSAGNTITNNRYTNLVIWGIISETQADSKILVNLPSGFYSSEADAIADVQELSNYNIPTAYRGTGFLIARLTLKYTTASSGTWTLSQNLDLRGSLPSIFAGGSAATSTEFIDSTFKLLDDLDETKIAQFQLSGISPSTTRTYTLPDLSMILAGTNVANAWGTANQNISATGKWQEGGVNISPIGIHDIPIGAAAMYAPVTQSATGLTDTEFGASGHEITLKTWDFTSTVADERVQFRIPLPRNYNNGTISVQLNWSFASGTGNVIWACRAVATGDNEAIATNFGTAGTVTAGAGTANQVQQDTISSITIGNTPADANEIHFEIFRNGANASDTFSGTARLHSAVIRITTDAAVAA